MILSLAFLFLTAAEEPSYGEIFVEDTTSRELPLVSTSVSYALDLNDSFSDLHSLVVEGQMRVWKYLSSGIMYQYVFPQLSSAGSRLKALEPTLSVSVGQLQWAVFSLTQLQFILGEWNVMNVFPLQAELLIGGGTGLTHKRPDTDEDGKNSFSYLWSIEQRFRIIQNAGISASLFGNTGGTFLSVGAHARF